jgi:predicted nucleic acid-binding protein
LDAFDADVLIYAAVPGHALGTRVHAALDAADAHNVGSVFLLTELLAKPTRDADHEELTELAALLSRVELLDLTHSTALLAVELGAKYRLRAADAVHLATAVNAGADRFVTNNHDDFPKTISELDVVYPADL